MSEPNPNRFTCFLIGADSLLIECAELLRAAGHDIRGVITSTDRLVKWAEGNSFRVLDPTSYRGALSEEPFDYLFAITHLAILPDEILSLPRKMAINFHDGPLPRYAGLNAPAWALMNQEPTYGISWHAIASDVDAGDILKQRTFDIARGETSLSLNTRNFETAIETFGELISELASDSTRPTKQDASQRSYFGKHDRPPAGCQLDWTKSAKELEAFVRALDFGSRYANPLGTPKLHHGGKVFSVTKVRALEDAASGAPGAIEGKGDGELRVATGSGVLSISGLETLAGDEVCPVATVESLGLGEGDRLGGLDDASAQQLTDLSSDLSRSEAFFARRLARLEPVEIPYVSGDASGSAQAEHAALPIAVPDAFQERFASSGLEDALTAAFAAFLFRLGQKSLFDVGFADTQLRDTVGSLDGWLGTRVPLRVTVPAGASFSAFLDGMGAELTKVRKRKTFLLDLIARRPELRGRSDLASGGLLPVAIEQRSDGSPEAAPGTVLTLIASPAACHCVYDKRLLSSDAASALQDQLATFLGSLAEGPDRPLSELLLLSEAERQKVLRDWNQTATEYRRDVCVHQLFEEQAERTPHAPALVFEDETLTYQELNERANRLAHHLHAMGVGPDTLVGVCVERSHELLISALATQKAGGAYVPLDPEYPTDRIAFMIADSKAPVIITHSSLLEDLPDHSAQVVRIDTDWPEIEKRLAENVKSDAGPESLAYVIYTSGSTGKPKGVMVEHRNAVSFFVGMDNRIAHDPPGTWMAVTSLSFDISVLELFWTITRGFKVVLYRDRVRTGEGAEYSNDVLSRPMDFGLFYWGNDDGPGPQKYRLLLEGAKFADKNGFTSVSTPERHFHAFGGPYPNPAVTGAAVAAVTENVSIRAGSCVMPLHHPIRIAEEWAVLDNLCGGRAAIGVASGWQPDDFVLRPENAPPNNKKAVARDLEIVRRLWRGDPVEYDSPGGGKINVVTQPRPVQKELPVWVTIAGNPDTWRMAGEVGANVLTHLLGQSIPEVGEKIKIYRKALEDNEYDPDAFKVTLMLHTFVGDDREDVREISRQPMKDYLNSAVGLVKQYAWAFPAFKRPAGAKSALDVDLTSLTDEEVEGILDFAFERYFEDSGLFGTIDDCVDRVNQLKALGVDEIACLIDYGVPTPKVLDMLVPLAEVVRLSNLASKEGAADQSLPAQMRRHQVSHLQCTPSMARMLTMEDEARGALAKIDHMMVGGEAFPPEVARELVSLGGPTVTNMYGPTETTIWSSTQQVTAVDGPIPIGRPIANTQLYVLDDNRQPVPVGVPGELYIAGDGVVRGYLDRPDLTGERFVPNPFGEAGARMYRTGDLVRYRHDGVVEFLGRTDHQVKIRGYRIELGEIETQLSMHDGVREGVVIAREDTPGDQRLVAYVVSGDPVPESSELRDQLREKLPEYMVPSNVVFLDAMPLTPNGKVDRKALPAPEMVAAAPQAEYVAPTSDLEQKIAEVWQDTLGLEQVGMEDNFFDIGGHSLLVVRVHRSLKGLVDSPVSLTDLYRFPTIRSLVEYVSSGGESETLKESADRAAKRRESMRRRRRR